MPKAKHPMQPLVRDKHKAIRFKENKIVSALLEHASKHGLSLNELAVMEFSVEDREQLAQLIGYSLTGFGELSYVRDETYNKAHRRAKTVSENS